MEREPRVFDKGEIRQESGRRFHRQLSPGQADHLRTLRWQGYFENAGCLQKFVDIWCPKADLSQVTPIQASIPRSTARFRLRDCLSLSLQGSFS